MSDVRDGSALVNNSLDQEPATIGVEAGVSVRHENLRVDVGLRQATAQPEVLLSSTTTHVTNLPAEYT